jgi:hypothetical protein
MLKSQHQVICPKHTADTPGFKHVDHTPQDDTPESKHRLNTYHKVTITLLTSHVSNTLFTMPLPTSNEAATRCRVTCLTPNILNTLQSVMSSSYGKALPKFQQQQDCASGRDWARTCGSFGCAVGLITEL